MEPDIIEAFRESTFVVFRTMLGIDLVSQDTKKLDRSVGRGVSGIIGLTGGFSGDVIVSMTETFASEAAGALLGLPAAEVQDDMVDAVGELTNMIVGSAKGRLEKYEMSLALPTVILGDGYQVGFKTGIQPISILFGSLWGDFNVDLGLDRNV